MSDEPSIEPELNRAQVRQKNRVVLPKGIRIDKDIKIGDVLDFVDMPDDKDHFLVKVNRIRPDNKKKAPSR